MATLEDVLGALALIQQELVASRAETAALKAQVDNLQRNPFDATTSRTPSWSLGQGSSTNPPISVVVPTPIPLAAPERYSGDPNTVKVFLTQISLHFLCKPAAFATNQSRVAFLLSYLSGDAASWAVPLVSSSDPILTDWDAFKLEFEKVFDRRATTLCADKELLDLHQGKSDLVSYLTSFNRLIAETSWPEEKRLALYYKGLSDDLKDVLAQIDPQPTTCTDLINLTLRLDHRMSERTGEKKHGDRPALRSERGKSQIAGANPASEPMDIGVVRSPLTKEEKDLRRRNGQCLYCGKKGHFVRECPLRPQNRGPLGRFRKVTSFADKKAEN